MASPRALTAHETNCANRLKAIYQLKKETLNLSQRDIGNQLGMTQAAVGQYMNGRIPMGLEIKFSFSKILHCSIQDIDPACPYSPPLTVDEEALIEAFRYWTKLGNMAGAKALLQVAELSPGYQEIRQREQRAAAIVTPGSLSSMW